jgi:ketosteroid isomerase-like protein
VELWAAFADVEARPERFIAHLWTLRDGRLARCEVFSERQQALEAVGLD